MSELRNISKSGGDATAARIVKGKHDSKESDDADDDGANDDGSEPHEEDEVTTYQWPSLAMFRCVKIFPYNTFDMSNIKFD